MASRVLRLLVALPLLAAVSGPISQAPVASAATGTPYAFSWSATPTSPQPWNPSSGFDVVVHDRDFTQTWDKPYSFDAQHGTNCGPFAGFGVGGTHLVTTYADEVFVCNNHMMTSVNGQGYGEVAFAPAELLDWTNGPVAVSWQVDTLRTSCRDWLSFNVMPFMDNLMLTDGIGVDLYHEPRNELMFTGSASCPTSYSGTDIRNFNGTPIPGPGGAVSDVVSESTPDAAKNRQTFELDISSTHVRFGMPAFGKWFVDGNLSSPLPYKQAIIQFEQHSYTPDKQCSPTPTFCAANTWHWSNIAISNAVPFTILRADKFQVTGGHTSEGFPDTVHLPAPAPANSFLRFEAISAAGSVKFSTDGGASWITPTHQQPSQDAPTGALTDSRVCLYFWPIPAGTTTIKFQARDAYWTWNAIRNISVWSAAGVVTVPAPPPVAPPPTPVPAPPPVVQGPAPTPTPVVQGPRPTPTPVVQGPRSTPPPSPEEEESQPPAEELDGIDLVSNVSRALSPMILILSFGLAAAAGIVGLALYMDDVRRRRPGAGR